MSEKTSLYILRCLLWTNPGGVFTRTRLPLFLKLMPLHIFCQPLTLKLDVRVTCVRGCRKLMKIGLTGTHMWTRVYTPCTRQRS